MNRAKTPLLYALKKQHAELARFLIKSGADLFGLANNKDNNTGARENGKDRRDNRCSFEMYHIFGTTDPNEVLHIVMSRYIKNFILSILSILPIFKFILYYLIFFFFLLF